MDDLAPRPNEGTRREQPPANAEARQSRLRNAYLLSSLILVALYPLLPSWGRDTAFLLASLATIPAVLVGLRRISRTQRRVWVLLLSALVVINVANLLALLPGETAQAASSLLDAAGNLVVLAAAVVLVSQCGGRNLGSIIDTSIVALALGGLLWNVVLSPNLLASYDPVPAKFALFVVVFALSGVLGALAQLVIQGPFTALRPLIAALALALVGNIVLAVTTDPTLTTIASMMFIGAYTAIGLFGLDPAAEQLVTRAPERPDQLSPGRLMFLGLAVGVVPIVVGVRQLVDGSRDGLVLVVSSTTIATLVMVRIWQLSAQRNQAEQELRHEATHDSLTGLPNRREFVAQLGQELTGQDQTAVVFCDLDRFKAVNDRFGHAHGDQVLVEVAHRLSKCVRAYDVVTRLGGDEFVILLRNTNQNEVQTINQRIVDALTRPVFVSGEPVTVGISTGTALAAAEADPEELIVQADHAMYANKANTQPGSTQ